MAKRDIDKQVRRATKEDRSTVVIQVPGTANRIDTSIHYAIDRMEAEGYELVDTKPFGLFKALCTFKKLAK